MNLSFRRLNLCISCLVALMTWAIAGSQQPATVPPVEVISFKIGSDYYPMLDRQPSPMSAENSDFPRPPTEVQAQQNRRRTDSERMEDLRSRGKLRSTLTVVSEAQWINLTVRNTSVKPIKRLTWDFAFPRYEDGKLILRAEVVSQTEIKPGGKKTLKQMLPPGASRCQALVVSAEDKPDDKAKTFEAVCGRGFNDPTQLKQTQETVTLKRLEYADGSVWP